MFLAAMKRGDWVLLDELNLAPQSVLEGLNACFDHREEVYLPELGMTVRAPSTFRVFCAQNPMAEGGGRKGLPQSFLTRFSRVYVDSMTTEDMEEIALSSFASSSSMSPPQDAIKTTASTSSLSQNVEVLSLQEEQHVIKKEGERECDLIPSVADYVPRMVQLIRLLQSQIVDEHAYARQGAPWEFNLRDVFRWCELVKLYWDRVLTLDNLTFARVIGKVDAAPVQRSSSMAADYIVAEAAYSLFVARLREKSDKQAVCEAFLKVFGYHMELHLHGRLSFFLSTNDEKVPTGVVVGNVRFREFKSSHMADVAASTLYLSSSRASAPLLGNLGGSHLMQTLAQAVRLRWPVLLVGPSGSGKRRAVRALASATGRQVLEFSATSSTDSTELLGSFEQSSSVRAFYRAMELVTDVVADLLLVALHSLRGDSDDKSSVSGDANFRAIVEEGSSLLSIARLQSVDILANNLMGLPGGATLDDTLQELMICLGKACSLYEVLDATPNMVKAVNSSEMTGANEVSMWKNSLTSAQRLLSICFQREGFDAHLEKESTRRIKGSKRKERGRFDPPDHKKSHSVSPTPAKNETAGFEWVDGVVVKAVERGHWLLIDNVNLCSASVLDRLNSLLEPDGTLLLTEGGKGRTITPHKGFRIFLTMDAQYGEISRAMRNRCLEVAVASSDQENSVDALMDVVQSIGCVQIPSGLSPVVSLVEAFGATKHDSLLSPGVPRAHYVSRLLHMLSLETSTGCGVVEGLKRAVMFVLPPLVPILEEILANTQSRQIDNDDFSPSELFGSAIVSSSILPPRISSCLALLAHALGVVDDSTMSGIHSPNSALASFREVAHRAVRERELAASGALYTNLIADKRLIEIVDGYADFEKSSLIDSLLLELVYALYQCIEKNIDKGRGGGSWHVHLVCELLLSLSNTQPSSREHPQSVHEKFAELWATHEVNLATLATYGSEAMVCRESVETLFLPTESSDGYGNSQVSIASIVKWMAFGDSTIMARLLQQRQETQLQQDVSRALTITPQTRFSSLYSLACALESDRLVLDTPEAMILLATLKLTRACSVTARESSRARSSS